MGFLDLFRGKPWRIQGTGVLPEGLAKKVDLGDPLAGTGKSVLFCRIESRLYALDTKCPHEGGRISEGPLIEGKLVMCPLHNFQFDARTGKAVGRVCNDARTYRVRETGGDCEVWA
jgi:nitrite reductase/ring-hydroxylating ferredoxin subunit